jgi:galactokinase
LGGKINGSGSGGCVFVYAPARGEQVVEAMQKMGCDAWLVDIGDGTKIEL